MRLAAGVPLPQQDFAVDDAICQSFAVGLGDLLIMLSRGRFRVTGSGSKIIDWLTVVGG